MGQANRFRVVEGARQPMFLSHLIKNHRQTLDNIAIYRAKMLLGLIYRNELAIVVQQFGYEIEISNSKHGFWELKGYEHRLLEQFSKRAQHIQEVASEAASSQRKAWIASHSQRAQKDDRYQLADSLATPDRDQPETTASDRRTDRLV